jgi:apolipoprotein N-acyltransferase
VVALVEWVDFTLVPVWGTAQSFARVWSAAPFPAQLVSAAGLTGLVFVLVSGQALLGRLLWGERRRRVAAALGLGLLLAMSAGWCARSWTRPASGEITVAAIGWTASDLRARLHASPAPPGSLPVARPQALFEKLYRPLVEEAARRGAEIIASPEVGFFLGPAEEREILAETARLARELRRTLVLGYFSRRDNNNRAVLVDAEGALRADYVKSHLIAFVESYRAGPGRIAVAEASRPLPAGSPAGAGSPPPAARVGLMICQDDNFTDLARAYGRAGAQLVAVPTNDWAQVKDFHLESSIFRATENRYAVLRAASNGVSAVISPRGEVLARRDHFRDGPGLAVARVPLGGGPTVYSLVGDWPPLAGLLLLAFGWLRAHRLRRRAAL